jgi:hypothetical protein
MEAGAIESSGEVKNGKDCDDLAGIGLVGTELRRTLPKAARLAHRPTGRLDGIHWWLQHRRVVRLEAERRTSRWRAW